MRKLVAFLLTGLALYGAYWFAANRLFDEGSYRKQVAFGSVFVPYGWAYALGFLGALVLLVLLYSLLYTALVNRLQGRRKSPWPLFLQGVTHLFLWVLILLVYYPVVQVVAASFDPTNNLFSFRRPDTGFLLVDAKVIPYLPNPSLENYAKLVEGVVLYPYQVALALLAGLALLGVGIVGLLRRLLAPEAWMDFWQGRLLFLMALLVFALALPSRPGSSPGRARRPSSSSGCGTPSSSPASRASSPSSSPPRRATPSPASATCPAATPCSSSSSSCRCFRGSWPWWPSTTCFPGWTS